MPAPQDPELAGLLEEMAHIIQKDRDGAPRDVIVADLNEFHDKLYPFLSDEGY